MAQRQVIDVVCDNCGRPQGEDEEFRQRRVTVDRSAREVDVCAGCDELLERLKANGRKV